MERENTEVGNGLLFEISTDNKLVTNSSVQKKTIEFSVHKKN